MFSLAIKGARHKWTLISGNPESHNRLINLHYKYGILAIVYDLDHDTSNNIIYQSRVSDRSKAFSVEYYNAETGFAKYKTTVKGPLSLVPYDSDFTVHGVTVLAKITRDFSPHPRAGRTWSFFVEEKNPVKTNDKIVFMYNKLVGSTQVKSCGISEKVEFIFRSDNAMFEKSPGVAKLGMAGNCECPDGTIYRVGVTIADNTKLACENSLKYSLVETIPTPLQTLVSCKVDNSNDENIIIESMEINYDLKNFQTVKWKGRLIDKHYRIFPITNG
jgi:hypothetical protein